MSQDFVCGEEKGVVDTYDFPSPDCFLEAQYMAPLSQRIRQEEKKKFCVLPLCQIVEAQMLGGLIKYTADEQGPRVVERRYKKLKELPMTEEVPCPDGLCKEVAKGLADLKAQGEYTQLNVQGPLSILSSLVPMERIFVSRRKDRATYEEALFWVVDKLFNYMESMGDDVDLYSLADPVANINILGKEYAAEIATLAYRPLLEKLWAAKRKVHICPIMMGAIQSGGFTKRVDIEIDENLSYEDAILSVEGPCFVAHQCLKSESTTWNHGVLHTIELI
ncbi:MAG: hypothetical protein K6A30_06970 [Lachnospiraceae bacterium]|nr:hypothetical protein [Lachnospiraceae bacterium]